MTPQDGSTYSRDEARVEQVISMGTVESVRDVTISGTPGIVGGIAGAAAGAALGNTIGSGTGKTVATVLGGLAGAAGGAVVEKKVTTKPGLEITVNMDDGRTIAVVQEKVASETFAKGDRVRVSKDAKGVSRVSR